MRKKIWSTSNSNQADSSYWVFYGNLCLWKSSLFPYKSTYRQLHSQQSWGEDAGATNHDWGQNVKQKPFGKANSVFTLRLLCSPAHTSLATGYPDVVAAQSRRRQNHRVPAFRTATAQTQLQRLCPTTAGRCRYSQGHPARRQGQRQGGPGLLSSAGRQAGRVLCLSTGEFLKVSTHICSDFWAMARKEPQSSVNHLPLLAPVA